MKNFFLSLVFMLFLCVPSVAQQGPGGDPGGGSDPDEIPIDGGVGFLAAAGVAYGVKRWRDTRKQGEEHEE